MAHLRLCCLCSDELGEIGALGDIVEQTRVIFRKIEWLLKAAGAVVEILPVAALPG